MHSFNKHLLSSFYMLGSVLGAGKTVVARRAGPLEGDCM